MRSQKWMVPVCIKSGEYYSETTKMSHPSALERTPSYQHPAPMLWLWDTTWTDAGL